MELDTFFIAQRWKILEIIAKRPSSPIEIAGEIKTSVSYVSQQLKLLEAANLVGKEKTGAVDKGKPRTVFSILKEIAYLNILAKNAPYKKILYMNSHHKAILSIWLVENIEFHNVIEKVYLELEEDIGEIDGFFFNEEKDKEKIILISESKKIKQKLDYLSKLIQNKVPIILSNKNELKKYSSEKLIPILYSHTLSEFKEKVKGGTIDK